MSGLQLHDSFEPYYAGRELVEQKIVIFRSRRRLDAATRIPGMPLGAVKEVPTAADRPND